MAEWQQVSGDVTASQYGAMFAMLDTIGDRVYGVDVVEIICMPDAVGNEWDSATEGGDYLTQRSWVDVDAMELACMRDILSSCGGGERNKQDIMEFPEEVGKRIDDALLTIVELDMLARWKNRQHSGAEAARIAALESEIETYRAWYAIPRMQRAAMAVCYGGYSDGQALPFATLAEAMDYHHIPASALWHPAEYNAPSPSQRDMAEAE